MILLLGVVVFAAVFAWYVLRDLNKPLNQTLAEQNVPLKKADEVHSAPPSHGTAEVKVEEVAAPPVAKVKKPKITTGDKNKKKPGRKKSQ